MRTDRFQMVATVATCLMILGIPLFPRPLAPGLDIVTVLVPVALLGAVFLLRIRGLDEIPYRDFGIAATLFLLWALVSILAIGTHTGELLTWARYLSYFLLIPAVGLVATPPRDRRIILWALVIAGVGSSLYGFYQYVNPSIMYDTFKTSATIQVRIYSTFDNPNFFSEFLLLTICGSIALFGLYWKRSRAACATIVGALLIQLLALFLTYTRGSLIALAAGLVVGVLVFRPKLLAPLAALIVVVGALPPVFSRMMGVFSGDGSTMFRIGLWKAALTAIAQKPLFGGGLGDFLQIYQGVVLRHPELYQGVTQFEPHNSYLQIAAETGVIGGVLFFCAVASLVWAGLRLSRRLKGERRLLFQCAALLAGVTGIVLNALTSDSFQHPHAIVYFFVMGGLLIGLGQGRWKPPQVFGSSLVLKKLLGRGSS